MGQSGRILSEVKSTKYDVENLFHIPVSNTGFDFEKIAIRPKLKISQPGDIYEQEADRVAEKVMGVSSASMIPMLQSISNNIDQEEVGRKCNSCKMKDKEEEERMRIDRKASPSSDGMYALEHSENIASSINNVRSSEGFPLDASTREFMESRFGYDFGTIRIHSDKLAAKSAESINALAYTIGNDVILGEGRYAPSTLEGRRLLAHELTHVIQQRNAMQTAQIQRAETEPTAKTHNFNVSTSGCDEKPYARAMVVAAAREAFNKVLYTDCIKSKSLKDEILNEFDGLNIDCEEGDEDSPCGMASRYFTQTVNIYPKSLDPSKCGPLASTILHEVVHLTEWRLFGHGDLACACEKSCFGYGSGDASKCK